MSALELRSVGVSRGAGPVIQGVNVRVEAGEILALVGPNGAGKTSLVEAISGVLHPSSGEVLLNGTRLGRTPRHQRARQGLIHVEQGRAVFPGLTVEENISLTARSNSGAGDVLDLFPELRRRLSARAGVLSGGEQQMVALARSLAAAPSVLLIDEMSLGLAPVVVERLLPVVREVAERGVAVVLVEQFTNLALSLADSALIVANGQVQYSGAPGPLLQRPELLAAAYLGIDSA